MVKLFTEYIQQPIRQSTHKQVFTLSHILHNRLTTTQRMEANKRLLCTINGCENKRDRFGKVCTEHNNYKAKTGTYNPTTFSFNNQISLPIKRLMRTQYTSEGIEKFSLQLDRLLSNPYTHKIEVKKKAYEGSIIGSKEKIAKYIKDRGYSKNTSTHERALRLILVFRLYLDGEIEGGDQLKFHLGKALLPKLGEIQGSNKGLQLSLLVGHILLINYTSMLDKLANELY